MRPSFVLAVFLLTFTSANAAPDMAPAARQVLELFKTNDIVVLGEIHHVHEQRSLLTAIARENGKARSFDALATEAVWTTDQPVLDRYMSSGDEKEFFLEEGWLNSVNIREAFRAFYANRERICAVDADFYGPDKKEKRAVELKQRLASFPEAVRKILMKQSGKSVEQMIRDGEPVERDYLMSLAIATCLKAHRKVLVHLGAYHTTSLDPVYQKQTEKTAEWDATQWISYLQPGTRYTVVHNVIDLPADLDAAGKAMVAFYKAKGAVAPFLLPSKDLPLSIKKLMTEEGTESWRRSDYVIVGPFGTSEKKVKP